MVIEFNTYLSELEVKSLQHYLRKEMGLNFTRSDDKDFIRKIGYAAMGFEYSNARDFVDWVLKIRLNNQQIGKLASYLTIGETYFFREKKAFDFLEQIYLPALIRQRFTKEKRLKIWCAGCATGEEAYSIAILLQRIIPDIHQWDITILATDINTTALQKAKKGVFSKWSFRKEATVLIEKYFTQESSNEFHIIQNLKDMISFEQLNLIDENALSTNPKASEVDIIFCRNVLIYFSQEDIRKLTDRLFNSLKTGGILLVSPVEMSPVISPKFNKIQYSGYTIYQSGDDPKTNTGQESKWNYSKPASESELLNAQKQRDRDAQGEIDSQVNRLRKLLPEKEKKPDVEVEADSLELAFKMYNEGLLEDAEAILSRLTTLKPENERTAISLLAKIKANLGKLSEAQSLCERAIKLDKLDPCIYYLMATVMHEQGKDMEAIDNLKKAIYLDNDFVLAHFLLGNLNMKLGKYDVGKKSFNQAHRSLKKLNEDSILAESDGITVGRFKEILEAMKN